MSVHTLTQHSYYYNTTAFLSSLTHSHSHTDARKKKKHACCKHDKRPWRRDVWMRSGRSRRVGMSVRASVCAQVCVFIGWCVEPGLSRVCRDKQKEGSRRMRWEVWERGMHLRKEGEKKENKKSKERSSPATRPLTLAACKSASLLSLLLVPSSPSAISG